MCSNFIVQSFRSLDYEHLVSMLSYFIFQSLSQVFMLHYAVTIQASVFLEGFTSELGIVVSSRTENTVKQDFTGMLSLLFRFTQSCYTLNRTKMSELHHEGGVFL